MTERNSSLPVTHIAANELSAALQAVERQFKCSLRQSTYSKLGKGEHWALQELPCLNENLEGSVFRPLRSKLKRRPSCGGGLDTENTPHELIQQWSPPHKKPVISVKGKENEDNVFVLGRRPRKRRESSAGLCWDSLPDELLLGILSRLSLQDLLRTSRVCKRWHRLAFDESLWQSVDLVGKAQLDGELGQVLSAGVLRLRCPHTCIGQPAFKSTKQLRVQHMDLSSCTVETSVLEQIVSRCTHLNNISLEGLVLSDNIICCLGQNTELVRLNLCGCSGFSPESLAELLKSCNRLEEVNVSWCDFSSVHVQAISSNILSSVTQLNISGYRQNLTIEGEESIDFKSLWFCWIPV
ncbi:S-phase kinase-associated protein 2 [Triplophysa tibetana]|uniref:S-phase kinase-associated protein 2 n=1 Tax=Triplophysa tibetana TaxID=1572043 RepID=A0A5A9PFX4_9TELE|nr:S-phase kinase-associated protein 2 [Triplophysa tibetana]